MTDSPYIQAVSLLRRAITPDGFVAAIEDTDNYRRIWTRDSVITGLASLMTGDQELIDCFRDGLITLFNQQHPTGFMPSNVQPGTGKTSYGGTVGRADNPSWAVIGLCAYSEQTGDSELLHRFRLQTEKCFSVMDAWEFNGKHLVYVPQSGDWADEYIQHGYILFDQLLRIWALEWAARLYSREEWASKALRIREVVRCNFWNNQDQPELYAPNLRHQLEKAPMNFWFLGFNPARIYTQFDLQANALALLLGAGTKGNDIALLDLVEELVNAMDHLIPSFYPAIEETDWEMEELRNNYAYSFRNRPHEFHNGGLWPVWNGWMAAALAVHGKVGAAEKLTGFIHRSNALNNYEFNECLHGKRQHPVGVKHCVWSASGAIIAEQHLKGKRIIHR